MKERILILTSRAVRTSLWPLLKSLSGYELLDADAQTVEDAAALIAALTPTIVLVGLGNEDPDGLQIAARVLDTVSVPRFVLCADSEALRGVQADAFTHLLLPSNAEAVAIALQTAVVPTRARLLALTAPPTHGTFTRSHFAARTHRGLTVVPASQVLCFVADHKYITLQYAGGELLLDETLKGLADEFGERLVRIHRNTLVARNYINRLQRVAPGHVLLHVSGLNQPLVVSRRHVSGLRHLLSA